MDAEPAVPAAVVGRATGQIHPHVAVTKRHPVDTAVAQSRPYGGHGARSSRQVLVPADRRPVGPLTPHRCIMPPGRPRVEANQPATARQVRRTHDGPADGEARLAATPDPQDGKRITRLGV
jgi:hypothetical protein